MTLIAMYTVINFLHCIRANEQKRRQVYRGEIVRRLPFQLANMDEPVPTIDFSPRVSDEVSYDVQRADIDGISSLQSMIHAANQVLDFMHTISDLEDHARELADSAALQSIQETRSNLEKLIHKMNSFEPAFDRIAERSSKSYQVRISDMTITYLFRSSVFFQIS